MLYTITTDCHACSIQYDCTNDGTAKHLDGRLYVYEPFNSTQRTVLYCDPNDGINNNCEIGRGVEHGTRYWLNFTGSLPGDGPLTFYVAPRPSGVVPAPVSFDNAYAATVPGPGDYALYGLSGTTTTDCTGAPLQAFPPIIYDPWPAGVGCYEEVNGQSATAPTTASYKAFRPLEADSYAYFHDDLTTVKGYDVDLNVRYETPCTFDYPAWFVMQTCGGDGNPARARFPPYSTGTNYIDIVYKDESNVEQPADCYAANSTIRRTMCRYNQLWHWNPAVNRSFISPLYAKGLRFSRIPCTIDYPASFDCPGEGPAYTFVASEPYPLPFAGDYAITGHFAETTFGSDSWDGIDCHINMAGASPTCTRVRLDYTSGDVVSIEIEGSNIRVSYNDTVGGVGGPNVDLYCSKSIVAVAAAAPSTAGLEASTQASAWHAGVNATLAQSQMPVHGATFTGNMSMPFRNQSFICCTSIAIKSSANFTIAFVHEVLLTIQSLLVLPAGVTDYTLRIPTFEQAVADLREALCEWSCAVTRILPWTFSCSFGNTDLCDSGASCATTLGCNLANIPLFVADVIVIMLKTLRYLVDPDNNDLPSEDVLSTCDPEDWLGCIIDLVVLIISKALLALTNSIRAVMLNLDCWICALANIDSPTACDANLWAFFDGVLELIEGLINDILPLVIRLIYWAVKAVVRIGCVVCEYTLTACTRLISSACSSPYCLQPRMMEVTWRIFS